MCCLVPECGHLKRQLGLIQRYNAGEIPISGPVVHCCKVCTVAISGILHQAVATAQHYIASLSFLVVGPLSRVRPRNGILGLVVVLLLLPLRSEFIGEL